MWQSKNCQYEGQWKADAQDGQGRQTWSDGRVYEGAEVLNELISSQFRGLTLAITI